jgi:outer membrane lipoprotein SlyB
MSEVKSEKVKETKCDDLRELQSGDHIVTAWNDTSFCHFIISSVELHQSEINVIYFDDGEINGDFEVHLRKADNYSLVKSGIKEASLIVTVPPSFQIFKTQYGEIGEACLKPSKTVKKAKSYLGQKKYNVFINNDEHFATYCKTGKAGKLFVVKPEDVSVKSIIGCDLSDKLKGNLTQTGTNVLLVSTAKHIATKFPRNVAASTLPIIAEAAGVVLCVAVEGVSMGYDINKKYKQSKTGELESIKFKKYVAKRVTRGTVGVAGGIAGGVVGQMVIPIPILGAVIGGFIGGILGSALGHGQGILIGEIVEKVDNKVKEKKAEKTEKEKTYSQSYAVLEQLVLSHTDNLKKEESEVLLMLNFNRASNVDQNLNRLSGAEESEFLASLKSTIEKKEFDVYMIEPNEAKNDCVDECSNQRLSLLVHMPKET